jgi:hypothetical protein
LCFQKKYDSCDGFVLFCFKKIGGINIQPLQGWVVVLRIFVSTGFTGGYFYSTPSGLDVVSYISPAVSLLVINFQSMWGWAGWTSSLSTNFISSY